jgi:hypothetical protein
MITRDSLASQLRDDLHHRITRTASVNWAENAMMEEEFDERDLDTIRDITSRLGLADVREFGLTWEDCEGYLSRIGYRATSGPLPFLCALQQDRERVGGQLVWFQR